MLERIDSELFNDIALVYKGLGISRAHISADMETTPDMLCELLDEARPQIPKTDVRLFPTSFNAGPSLRGFPLPLTHRWLSCERSFSEMRPTAVMAHLPHFWQLEIPLHAACRRESAPIFFGEPENIPVAAAAIASASIDTVIAGAPASFALSSYVLQKRLPLPPHWILIHDAFAASWEIPAPLRTADGMVFQEVHAFPGLPILEQCATLTQARSAHFHRSNSFVWDATEKTAYITSTGDDPFPLYRYVVPFTIEPLHTCDCGQEVVTRKL